MMVPTECRPSRGIETWTKLECKYILISHTENGPSRANATVELAVDD
jgi:hypothetical protein